MATTDRPQYAREIRYALTDAKALCERLGLLAGHGTWQRQAGGVIVRCPWHDERHPSCSVRRASDGTIACKCHSCGATGDALSLVAAVRGLSMRSQFRDVLAEAAEVAGLYAVVDELRRGTAPVERPMPTPPPPAPERDYPPQAAVDAIWGACVSPADVPEVAAHMAARGLDPELLWAHSLVGALASDAGLPGLGGAYKGLSWWGTGHRAIVPMRDVLGRIRSLRAWRVTDGDSPKRLPPGGYRATGLVMADDLAQAMLAGTWAPTRVLIVEGEPDWCVWATRKLSVPTAILGIVSGSWNRDFAARVPTGATVVIRTDLDDAGERYAKEIAATLHGRCFVKRAKDSA
jgi:hypothetical protein